MSLKPAKMRRESPQTKRSPGQARRESPQTKRSPGTSRIVVRGGARNAHFASERVFAALRDVLAQERAACSPSAQTYMTAHIRLKEDAPELAARITRWETEKVAGLVAIVGNVSRWLDDPLVAALPVGHVSAFASAYDQFCDHRERMYQRFTDHGAAGADQYFRAYRLLYEELDKTHTALATCHARMQQDLRDDLDQKEPPAKGNAFAKLGKVLRKAATMAFSWGPTVYFVGAFLHAGLVVGLAPLYTTPVMFFVSVLCVAMLHHPYVSRQTWDLLIFKVAGGIAEMFLPGLLRSVWNSQPARVVRTIAKFFFFLQFADALQLLTSIVCSSTLAFKAAYGVLPEMLEQVAARIWSVLERGVDQVGALVGQIYEYFALPLLQAMLASGRNFWGTVKAVVRGGYDIFADGVGWVADWWGAQSGVEYTSKELVTALHTGDVSTIRGAVYDSSALVEALSGDSNGFYSRLLADVGVAVPRGTEVAATLQELPPEQLLAVVEQAGHAAGLVLGEGVKTIGRQTLRDVAEETAELLEDTGLDMIAGELERLRLKDAFDAVKITAYKRPSALLAAFFLVTTLMTVIGIVNRPDMYV